MKLALRSFRTLVVYDADLGEEKTSSSFLAKHLEKLTISLGQALPDLPVIGGPSITSGLDPQFPGWLPARGRAFSAVSNSSSSNCSLLIAEAGWNCG